MTITTPENVTFYLNSSYVYKKEGFRGIHKISVKGYSKILENLNLKKDSVIEYDDVVNELGTPDFIDNNFNELILYYNFKQKNRYIYFNFKNYKLNEHGMTIKYID